MENEEEIKIEEDFNKDSSDEIKKLFCDEQNEHVLFLKNALKKNSDIVSQLPIFTEYGLSHLKEGEENFSLSSFFFILAELKKIPDEVRDFFTDVMVLCEENGYMTLERVKENYHKKILPLL